MPLSVEEVDSHGDEVCFEQKEWGRTMRIDRLTLASFFLPSLACAFSSSRQFSMMSVVHNMALLILAVPTSLPEANDKRARMRTPVLLRGVSGMSRRL